MSSDTPDQTAFCRDCGAEIHPEAEICPECGVRQRDPPSPNNPPVPQQQKDSGLAAVLSLVIPGAGQVYVGQVGKGIVLGAITIILALTGVGLILAIPLWLYLVYDAYHRAQRGNEEAVEAMRVTDRFDEDAILSVLDWCADGGYEPHEALTVRNKVRATGVGGLAPGNVDFLVKAVDAYNSNSEPGYRELREQLIALWEQQTGADWETAHPGYSPKQLTAEEER